MKKLAVVKVIRGLMKELFRIFWTRGDVGNYIFIPDCVRCFQWDCVFYVRHNSIGLQNSDRYILVGF